MLQPRRRATTLVAVLALAALVMAACSSSKKTSTSAGGGKTTYALAYVGPLTGPNASLGINPRNGAQIAIDQANAAGGNITFDLKSFDTQGDPAQAPTVKDKYINDQSILGVVGPTFSGETKAVLPAYEAASLVMISPSATNVALPTVVPGGKSFHRIIPDDDVQGAGVAKYVTTKLAAKNIFYINDNSDYGKGLADGTQKILEAAGTKTSGTDAVDPKSQDFSAAVNKVKAANPKPDVVFYGGYYAEAGRLAKQLTDGGVKSIFMSGDGSLDQGLIDAAGANGAEGAQITCACKLARSTDSGALGAFATAFKAKFSKEPGTYSTEGFDAANMLIAGIKAGNTTRSKLRDYVNGIGTYKGAGKDIAFETNGNVKSGAVFVYAVKSAKLTLVGDATTL
ncbi:MAG: Extracellular ligand-binding receptor [Acidimicrobiales bacterium]|nr:Extracellular ligand-binding receptor [Acidimicrobiales bacterium]